MPPPPPPLSPLSQTSTHSRRPRRACRSTYNFLSGSRSCDPCLPTAVQTHVRILHWRHIIHSVMRIVNGQVQPDSSPSESARHQSATSSNSPSTTELVVAGGAVVVSTFIGGTLGGLVAAAIAGAYLYNRYGPATAGGSDSAGSGGGSAPSGRSGGARAPRMMSVRDLPRPAAGG